MGIREIAVVGSTTQFQPPDNLGEVEVVMVDADGVMQADGKTPVAGNHVNAKLPPSENDYCIGLRVRYGDIVYATAGDIDGEYTVNSAFGYSYNDVESVMAPRMGSVDILH